MIRWMLTKAPTKEFARFMSTLVQLEAQFLSTSKNCMDVSIPVPWGSIKGKWWGPTDKRPFLCLHGLYENCGTFDRLMPLLTNDVGFLTVDFPGHGTSTRIPKGLFYTDVLLVSLVQYIKDHYKWEHVSLLGHSLGGVVAYLYSLTCPKTVDSTVFIDGFYPPFERDHVKLSEMHSTLQALQDAESYVDDDFEILERLVSSLLSGTVEKRCLPCILERMTRRVGAAYALSLDPRLSLLTVNSFDKTMCLSASKDLICPVLIVKSRNCPRFADDSDFMDMHRALLWSSRFSEMCLLPVPCHAHLNSPEIVASVINLFLSKYSWAMSDR